MKRMKLKISAALILLSLGVVSTTIFYTKSPYFESLKNRIYLSSTNTSLASSNRLNYTNIKSAVTSQNEVSSSTEDQPIIMDYLKNSVFRDYKNYKGIVLDNAMSTLCFEVESNYKQYISSYCDKLLMSIFNSEQYGTLMIDSKKQDNISTGLFYYQTDQSDFELILLNFKDATHISATYLGCTSQEDKDIVDTLVKTQEFYQHQANQIAETFGIDLTQYLSANSVYDPPYGKLGLIFLSSSLQKSLSHANSREGFDSHIKYYIKPDNSGGIILNGGVNGMQYYHEFSINTQKSGVDRFEILETKSKASDPIKLSNNS